MYRKFELPQQLLFVFPEETPKQLDQDEIIEILDQAQVRNGMKQWLMPTLTFLKCLMTNLFLIPSI
jgi:hypothetical protein